VPHRSEESSVSKAQVACWIGVEVVYCLPCGSFSLSELFKQEAYSLSFKEMRENRRKDFHTKERLKELERGCGKTEKAFHTRSLKELEGDVGKQKGFSYKMLEGA
jgi:hypothetical protein